ncbi:MAG: hypothetical protein M0022_07100 [Desulfobacteraceae bacterium]|nr:hypothetical protein [Desulfobacteraceae bacterium]
MPSDYEQELCKILAATHSIINGEIDQEIKVDAEGIIGNIASAINKLIKNFREARPSFEHIQQRTPAFAATTKTIAELMEDSTQKVLDICDGMIRTCDALAAVGSSQISHDCPEQLKGLKAGIFDIISIQSYQDVARQQLEKMEGQLEEVRDTLIRALIILNLQKSPENHVEIGRKIIEHDHDMSNPKKLMSQDLVDELLAEYGL